MSVKGIVILNAGADRHYSQRANLSLNNFNANNTTREVERLSREQRELSEEIRERFKRAAEDETNQINYELYARDDDKKSPAVIRNELVILNPTQSMVKSPGRLSSPAECKTCANRRYNGSTKNKATPLQTSIAMKPSMAAEPVLGTGHLQDVNSYAQSLEETAHYTYDDQELEAYRDALKKYVAALEAYEESPDENEMPVLPTAPKPHLSHVTHSNHVVSETSAARSHAVHHHHHGTHAATVSNTSGQLRVDICPECGRAYISGSVANSKVKFFSDLDESNPYHQQLLEEASDDFVGNIVELDA